MKQSVNPLRRIAAFIYDLFIVIAIIMIGTYVLLPFTHGQAIAAGNHLYQAYLFLLILFYWAGFWYWRGQTIGMLAWRIKVVNAKSQPIKFWQAILRFLFGFILSFIALLFCFFNAKKSALYDIMTKTKVITYNYSKNQ